MLHKKHGTAQLHCPAALRSLLWSMIWDRTSLRAQPRPGVDTCETCKEKGTAYGSTCNWRDWEQLLNVQGGP